MLHELLSETQLDGIRLATGKPGIDKLSAEQLIRCQAGQELELFFRQSNSKAPQYEPSALHANCGVIELIVPGLNHISRMR